MKNIEFSEFKVNTLFTVKGAKNISKYEIELNGFGEYPYITRTENNNGISGFYDYKTVENKDKNLLTIETTLSGLCFYHDYSFSTGDHIMLLIPKKNVILNKYTALYIKTVWNKNAYKFSYGRPAIKERIENTSLLLPTTDCKSPDWKFMECYIKNIQQKIKFVSVSTNNEFTDKMDHNNWLLFVVNEIFNVYGSKTTPKLELENNHGDGEYPYITTKSVNNGVEGYFDYYSENKNVITIDSAVLGMSFYQDQEFSASDHVEILEPKEEYRNFFDKYTAMFIITMLRKELYKYDYGRKFNQDRIKATKILLPSDMNGKPDWEFMRNYIKKIPYGDKI